MRRITSAHVGRSVAIAGLVGALVAGVVPAAHASEPAPAPAAETTETGDGAAQAASVSGDITVGHARNQATGDVLGLGYEQVIRFDGPDVIITEPVTRGGAELRRFPAYASSSWPDWRGAWSPFTGQTDLVWYVKHEASRIAVLGDDVYVSRLVQVDGVWGAMIRKYSTDGVVQSKRWISGAAVTALDGYEYGGREYLAVGLSEYGVRVLRADEFGLPGFRDVHTDWIGHRKTMYANHSDIVTAVRLGTDAAGRLVLISGRLTFGNHAIVATDLRAAEPEGAESSLLWQHNELGSPRSLLQYDERWEFPDLIASGPLGTDGRPLVAVSWPRTGRVSVVDAETGTEWLSRSASTGAHALRFFEGGDGTGYLLIVRDAAGGVESFEIGTRTDQGDWLTVREGAKTDLPAALAELAGS